MLKDYIEESMYSEELAQSLNHSDLYPLVQELKHAFNLKVLGKNLIKKTTWSDHNNYAFVKEEDKDSDGTYLNSFLLGYKGMPRCNVYIDEKGYSFKNKYQIKERGKDDWERMTVSSHKISQIMKTLLRKKYKVDMASLEGENPMTIPYDTMVKEFIVDGKKIFKHRDALNSHIGGLQNYGNGKHIAHLIRNQYGDKKAVPHESQTFFEDYVDTHNKLLHSYESAVEIAKEEIGDGYIVVGTNDLIDGYVVLDYVTTTQLDDNYTNEYGLTLEVIQSEIYKSWEDMPFYDEIKTTLTMLRVLLEDDKEQDNFIKDYFLNKKLYSRRSSEPWNCDLGVYWYDSMRNPQDPYRMSWIRLPYKRKVNVDSGSEVVT